MFVAQHHLRLELTLMRTPHPTNILLPLSLITALRLSPRQNSTQPQTQTPRQPLSSPRAPNGRHMSTSAALPPRVCRVLRRGRPCVSLCREGAVCSLHGELCHYLILVETSCWLLGRSVIKHAAPSPHMSSGASTDNSLTRNVLAHTFIILIMM